MLIKAENSIIFPFEINNDSDFDISIIDSFSALSILALNLTEKKDESNSVSFFKKDQWFLGNHYQLRLISSLI